MKKRLTFLFTAIMVTTMASLSYAQVFWSEDFANGLPATWTNQDVGFGTLDWGYVPTVDEALYGSSPAFTSTTAANGFAQAQSPAMTTGDHVSQLTSEAIDCSAQTNVILSFNAAYAFFATANGAKVGVSSDGTTYTYYDLFPTEGANEFNPASELIQLDITADAAGQSTVYVQFQYEGIGFTGTSGDYYFKVDDVELSSEVTPVFDIAIDASQIAPNHLSPLAHADTVFFNAFVVNRGNQDATNSAITVSVEDLAAGAIVHTETVDLGTMAPADEVNVEFTTFYLPSANGAYGLKYELIQDDGETVPVDNITQSFFNIGGLTFAKEAGANNATRPAADANGDNVDYEVGSYYVIKETMEQYLATTVSFSAAKSVDDGALMGEEVTITLYEVTDNNDGTFDDTDLNAIGYNFYTFDAEVNFDVVTLDILDFTTNLPGVELSAGEYFITTTYAGNSTEVFFAYSDEFVYDYQVSTVVKTNEWFLGGFGSDIISDVRLGVEVVSANQEPELDESRLTIFPNPASDLMSYQIDLENTSANVAVMVTDVAGKSLYTKIHNNVQAETFTLNVASYPAGTYFLTVNTDEGVKTKRFSVAR